MTQLVIALKDDELKAEIEAAFAANFGNPDALTNEELVVRHVSNFIMSFINSQRIKVAVEAAQAEVVKLETLE